MDEPDAESDRLVFRYKAGRGLILARARSAELRFDAYAQLQVSNDTDLPENAMQRRDFQVLPRRLRAFVRGKTEHVGFKVSVDFARMLDGDPLAPGNNTLGAGEEILRSAWLEARASDELGVRVGYFKTPFGRQRIASSAALLLPIRSIATKKFTFERGLGLVIDGMSRYPWCQRGRVEYTAGLVHEHFDYPWTDTSPQALPPFALARVVVSPWGRLADREASIRKRRPRASFGVGVAYPATSDNHDGDATGERAVMGVDGAFEAQRLTGQVEVLVRRSPVLDAMNRPNPQWNEWGGYLQLGYLVVARHAQLAARIAHTHERQSYFDSTTRFEAALGASLFMIDERLMVQTAVSWLSKCVDRQCDPKDEEHVVTLQLQAGL